MWFHPIHDPFTFPVKSTDTVIDVGGFYGEWSGQMWDLWGCTIHIFEPVPAYAEICRQSLPHCVLHEVGLGVESGQTDMTVAGLASSMVGGGPLRVPLMGVGEFFAVLPGDVAVMKINIEGYEYDLLDKMIALGLFPRVKSFVIQFHMNVPDYEKRWAAITGELEKTHWLSQRHRFVWERWDRND